MCNKLEMSETLANWEPKAVHAEMATSGTHFRPVSGASAFFEMKLPRNTSKFFYSLQGGFVFDINKYRESALFETVQTLVSS